MSRKVKIIIWTSFASVLFLSLATFIHILMVTRPSDEYHAPLSLSRIDFPVPLDSSQQVEALKVIRGYESVSIAKLNSDKSSLVYAVNSDDESAKSIASEFSNSVSFQSVPFEPPAMEKGKGCPVLNKKGMMYRVTTFIHNTF